MMEEIVMVLLKQYNPDHLTIKSISLGHYITKSLIKSLIKLIAENCFVILPLFMLIHNIPGSYFNKLNLESK